MATDEGYDLLHRHAACGCCGSHRQDGLSRREFIAGLGAGLATSSWAAGALADVLGDAGGSGFAPPGAKPLRVQPVLVAGLYSRAEKTSWRSWGGLHTQADIEQEQRRIAGELAALKQQAGFGLEILPLVTLKDTAPGAKVAQGDHDVLLMYAANWWNGQLLEALTNPAKWTMIFLRHKSGPVSLWYEIIHNRFLRKTVDQFGQPGVDYKDVVVDSGDEVLWRFRALHGLRNTLGKKVVTIGGPAGWGAGGAKAPRLAKEQFKFEYHNVSYDELGPMIDEARRNTKLVKRCEEAAQRYLAQSGITLATGKEYVSRGFVLTEVFKAILAKADTDAFTINNCMGTIMGVAETTACLPLSLLNDAGYAAFCESDFVVIPSGVLLHHISGLPVFLNDPTFPHDGVVTLAHCTAPRKMDGKHAEPTLVTTHFESDYGAAPKVEMRQGQTITVIDPDFDGKVWLGLRGEIIDNPFLDICRSQIDVKFEADTDRLNAETKGFHWMVCYGDYLRETGYALNKVGVDWLNLSA